MAIRKPIPKTQKEISIDRQTPTSETYGNPNIPFPINENQTSIDLTNLKDAVYIVKVENINSKTVTFKIVKN